MMSTNSETQKNDSNIVLKETEAVNEAKIEEETKKMKLKK